MLDRLIVLPTRLCLSSSCRLLIACNLVFVSLHYVHKVSIYFQKLGEVLLKKNLFLRGGAQHIRKVRLYSEQFAIEQDP